MLLQAGQVRWVIQQKEDVIRISQELDRFRARRARRSWQRVTLICRITQSPAKKRFNRKVKEERRDGITLSQPSALMNRVGQKAIDIETQLCAKEQTENAIDKGLRKAKTQKDLSKVIRVNTIVRFFLI